MTKKVELDYNEAIESLSMLMAYYRNNEEVFEDKYRNYVLSMIGNLSVAIDSVVRDIVEWDDPEEEASYPQYEVMLEDFADKLAGVEASIAELSTKWSERYHEACSYTYEPEQLTRIYVAIDTAYEMNDKAQIDKYNAELYNACVTKSLIRPTIMFTSAEANLLRKLVFSFVDNGAAPVGETWYQLQTVKRKLNVYLDGILGDREYNEINSVEDGESDDQNY